MYTLIKKQIRVRFQKFVIFKKLKILLNDALYATSFPTYFYIIKEIYA